MPPPIIVTSWRESVMSDDRAATPVFAPHSSLRTHDQGHGRRRLMIQCTRGSGHGDGVGAGLCALLLTATTPTAPAPPTPPSSAPARSYCPSPAGEQDRQTGNTSITCRIARLSSDVKRV